MLSIRDFGRRIFLDRRWELDLFASLCFSLLIGTFIQLAADSGGRNTRKVLFSIFIASVSYLASYSLSFFSQIRRNRYPSWVWIGALGSILYAFNRMFVYFLVVNWNPTTEDSFQAYLYRLLPIILSHFVWGSLLFCLLVLAIIFFFRLVAASIDLLDSNQQLR